MSDDKNDEQIISLPEYIDDDNDDLRLVLGGCIPSQGCTYKNGYVKRQALFVCKTCNNGKYDRPPAAVCYACIEKCHVDHEYEELHTKRYFRCDCGNEKFTSPCLFIEDKDDTNCKNKYNHNFHGLYCYCEKPEGDSNMYQCIVCEDWIHENCLFESEQSSIIESSSSERCRTKLRFLSRSFKEAANDCEIICSKCATEFYSILGVYAAKLSMNLNSSLPEGAHSITSISQLEAFLQSTDSDKDSATITSSVIKCCHSSFGEVFSTDLSDSPQTKRLRLDCGTLDKDTAYSPIVWLTGWRDRLCRCDPCKLSMQNAGLTYLYDSEDTYDHYMTVAESRIDQLEEKLMDDFLTKSDVVYRNHFLLKLNEFSKNITNYFGDLVRSGKGTTENPISYDDIKQLVDNLKNPPQSSSGADSSDELGDSHPDGF